MHNAGALTPTYQTTAEGVERTLATQVFGPYLLTAALAPLLFSSAAGSADGSSAPPTIVTMSSGGMYSQRFDLGTLETGPDGYDGVVAYARAKRAQLVLADAWADRFAPAPVASYAMHPGWVDTPGLAEGLPEVPHPDASAAAHARRRGGHRGVAGRRGPDGGGAGRRDRADHLGLLPRPASPLRPPLSGHPPERSR